MLIIFGAWGRGFNYHILRISDAPNNQSHRLWRISGYVWKWLYFLSLPHKKKRKRRMTHNLWPDLCEDRNFIFTLLTKFISVPCNLPWLSFRFCLLFFSLQFQLSLFKRRTIRKVMGGWEIFSLHEFYFGSLPVQEFFFRWNPLREFFWRHIFLFFFSVKSWFIIDFMLNKLFYTHKRSNLRGATF